jgi:hypothetical protein
LGAYAFFNAAHGYCQSHNQLAGFLLLFMPEEEAFWTFVSLTQDILPRDLHAPTLVGLMTEQLVLRSILRDRDKKLFRHLEDISLHPSLYSTAWILASFVDILPVYV